MAKSSAARRSTRSQARAVVPVTQPKRASFTATEAKNEFGRLLERAIQGDSIVITRHDSPKAVLISIDEYNALRNVSHSSLDALTSEFDAMFERMQTPKAVRAMDAGFHATAAEMGKAAIAAARKRG
jgi:prevent-host-death family protein